MLSRVGVIYEGIIGAFKGRTHPTVIWYGRNPRGFLVESVHIHHAGWN
jgi:hypothetical protein